MTFEIVTIQSKKQGPRDMTSEVVVPGVAITPLQDAGHFTGWWTLTHVPSGTRLSYGSPCLVCVRKAAEIAVGSGVDWSRDGDTIKADPAAKAVVLEIREVTAFGCTAEDCSPPEDFE